MKRIIAAIYILSILYTLAASVPPVSASEAILNWHSEITVHQDASMTVTETIKVRAEGSQIKRGIYRDFPTKYRDRLGNRVTVAFTLFRVERDGRAEPYHTKTLDNGIRIYAGKSDVFLKPGVYTYRITYDTDQQLGFFEEHDELYWNVTGNGWPFPIHKATAAVTLPPGIPAGTLQATGYVGPEGSREQNIAFSISNASKATFSSRRSLGAHEGLTIVLGWPKGYVTEPGWYRKTVYLLSDNRELGAVAGCLIILFIYYFWAWRKAGKDPEKGVVIPLFTPPDNLSPAAMRYIMGMGFDNDAFAAAVINLAVKGYLTITEESKAFGLSKTFILNKTGGKPKTPLSRGEQKVAQKLFPGRLMTLELEKRNHHTISTALEALKDLLRKEYHKSAFVHNSGYVGFGVLASAAIIVLMGFSIETRGGIPLLFILLWFIPWTVATLVLWATRQFMAAAIFSVFLVGAGIGFAFLTSVLLIAAIVLLALINLAFYIALKAPTRLGRRMMDKIEGFKMYLSTAEEHRLEKLHPPEKTPELFEKYLPYALALDVSQQWSEKFSDVLHSAAQSVSYSPNWYRGSRWDYMNPGRFASDLGSSISSSISSSSTSSGSSSGFSGGGSSGGGGGGGGGGGW